MIRLVPRTNVSSRFASVPCAVLYSDLVWLLSLDRITDCPISSISLQQQLFPGSLLNQFETHPSAASHPANPNPGSLRLKIRRARPVEHHGFPAPGPAQSPECHPWHCH